MMVAVVDKNRQDYIREFCNELEDAIDTYQQGDQEDEDKEALLHTVMVHNKAFHQLRHLLLAYQTIFDYACDPDSGVLEFKKEIKELLTNNRV